MNRSVLPAPARSADLPLGPTPTLHRPTPGGAAALATSLALRPDAWSSDLEYRSESRWTHLLDPAAAAAALHPALHAELAAVQIWLLSWLPGQGTPLHDHGASAGAFAVARGTLTERVVAARQGRSPRRTTADLTAGRVRSFGPHYVHQVVNTGPEPAMSVHVYTPQLRLMNTYRIDPQALVRTGTERAGVDW